MRGLLCIAEVNPPQGVVTARDTGHRSVVSEGGNARGQWRAERGGRADGEMLVNHFNVWELTRWRVFGMREQ